MLRKMFFLGCLSFFLSGCQSTETLPEGIQNGYEAVNPASILAVRPFLIANPALSDSAIDNSLLVSSDIVNKVENKIIESFQGQPNINGYPFSAVERAVKDQSPNSIEYLNSIAIEAVRKLSARDIKTRLKISPQCFARKNFLEFYSYCLAHDSNWLKGLNSLSAKVLNADSALFVFIDNLQAQQKNNQYEIQGGLAVLLVDTNNGNLIWGKEVAVTLRNPPDNPTFPNWTNLVNSAFSPDFWLTFPGRIRASQNLGSTETNKKK